MLIHKQRSPTEIQKSIRSHIMKKLADKKLLISLSECAKDCHTLRINTDEDDEHCKFCKDLAQNVIKDIKQQFPTEAKSNILPLQGPNLWHQWAQHDKESNRHVVRYKTSIEHYNSLKDSEKLKLQLQCSESLTSVMSEFLQILVQCKTEIKILLRMDEIIS